MSLTTTLTERASQFVGRKTSRRGFLARSAIVGSAIAVAGKEFVLEPRSAYAATCGCNGRNCDCGSLCCDGYTEFCCAIYGQNSCPPGTLLAGWWKVDGSSYCNGAARYYMDCNDSCGGCGCGANGVCSGTCSGANCGCRSCGNRKDGCTHFRYGNCNNQVPCVGPIMCRVVTCTKPWEIEPTCTTASRVDNATRNHHRPCLEDASGTLTSVTTEPGGLRIRGSVSGNVTPAARIEVFVDRSPVQSFLVGTGSFDVHITQGPGIHEVCVYLDAGGSSEPVEVGCKTVTRIS
ncbi:twin-arginine translocation signal domain-containing protein [Actinospongicola halichondriae]|uniref:twin-arginine translocation signal domain-containing protein n=1 Tax=Actinospongicola halichondriae TaxID=3236844 RepID=UPI003D504363